jgi:hypothetical protein
MGGAVMRAARVTAEGKERVVGGEGEGKRREVKEGKMMDWNGSSEKKLGFWIRILEA